MILLMVHVETLESRLGNALTFEELELRSQLNKLRLSNESVLEIVALEDIIDVEGLGFVGRNRKIL
jgi:hypothetical protein